MDNIYCRLEIILRELSVCQKFAKKIQNEKKVRSICIEKPIGFETRKTHQLRREKNQRALATLMYPGIFFREPSVPS